MSDYELNPGFFDEDYQHDPAWVAWAQPERIAGQVDLLFAETLPVESSIGEPRPEAERYSGTMIGWACTVFDDFFPDEEALTEPENRHIADQFVCYFGEAFRILAGGEWFNARLTNGEGSILFGKTFVPAIGYRWGQEADDLEDLLFDAVDAQDAFMEIGIEISSRSVDFAETADPPRAVDEVEARRSRT